MEPEVVKVESGVQFFSRINQRTYNLNNINPHLLIDGGPFPNQTIEISGEFTNHLLVDFLIRCILPTSLNENFKESSVAFINTDHHISLIRITKVMDAYLKHLKAKHRKSVIESALSKITFFNVFDYEQFVLTIRNLERILRDKDDLSLVIVDNITAQYWAQRNESICTYDYYAKNILSLIESVIKNMNVVLIFSRVHTTDPSKNLNVDYKIVANKNNFCVMNHNLETTTNVSYNLETFITFIKTA